MSKADAPISRAATVGVYRLPTSAPESDGTLTWDATTAVTVALSAAGRQGLGWTYSTAAAAALITDHLIPTVAGRTPPTSQRCYEAMHRACRNLGTRGLVMQAISAVDIALWDLKARLLGVPLSTCSAAPRQRSGLRLWRLHLNLRRRAERRADRRLEARPDAPR